VHTDARDVGIGGAQVVSADQRCRLLGVWVTVHVLDAILLPEAAARYAKPGPYAVTQAIMPITRSKQRAAAPVRCLYALFFASLLTRTFPTPARRTAPPRRA
jgi:hypothetical protein